jgi:hypothetical protein
MAQYDYREERTQAVTGGYPAESPTEVVGGAARVGGGLPPRVGETVLLRAKKGDPSFAWLVVVKGRREGVIHNVNKGETMIGRDAENEIALEDDYCSRRHAKIKLEPDPESDNQPAYFIYDLATPNGTFVNGEQILRTRLVDGVKVQIGETVMVFKKV